MGAHIGWHQSVSNGPQPLKQGATQQAQQAQQAMELASVMGPPLARAASIESNSESIVESIVEPIQSSNACSLSSSFSRISHSGSRRQVSVAPAWRVALGRSDNNERNQGNHQTGDGLKHIEPIERDTTRAGLHQRQAGATPSAPTPTRRP